MSEKQRFTSNIVAKDSRKLNGSETAGGGGGGSESKISYWDSDMEAPIEQPLEDIYINGDTGEITVSGKDGEAPIEHTFMPVPDGSNAGYVLTLDSNEKPVWVRPVKCNIPNYGNENLKTIYFAENVGAVRFEGDNTSYQMALVPKASSDDNNKVLSVSGGKPVWATPTSGGGKSKIHTQTIGADLSYEPSANGSVPYWVMDSPFNLDFDVSARTGFFVLNITEMYIESNGTNGLDTSDLKPVTGRVCIFDESNVNMIGCMPLTGRVMSAGASGAVIGLFTEAFETGAYSGTIAIPLALTSVEATSNLTLRVYIDTPLTFNASLQSSSAGDINAELKYVYDFDEVTTQ